MHILISDGNLILCGKGQDSIESLADAIIVMAVMCCWLIEHAAMKNINACSQHFCSNQHLLKNAQGIRQSALVAGK